MVWFLAWAMLGCGGVEAPPERRSEADADADADVDADADADADSDTETGSDTGFVGLDPLTCDYVPCGGDPVGAWVIDDLCLITPLIDRVDCAAATVQTTEVLATGVYALRADGRFFTELSIQVDLEVRRPRSCFGRVDECGDVGPACVGDPAVACTCPETQWITLTDAGSWTVSGGQLTTTSPLGTTDVDFCVDGDTLLWGGVASEGTYVMRR